MGSCGIFWDIVGYWEILLDILEYFGILWEILRYCDLQVDKSIIEIAYF